MTELYNNFLQTIITYQYELNKLISTSIRSINDESSITLSLSVIVIAFVYGLVHAAGPGHGKALVAFYFTSNKSDYKKAFKMGFLIAVIHAASALAVTFGIFFLLKKMFRQHFNDFSEISMLISAVLIILVGLYLIWHSYSHRKEREQNIQKSNKSELAVAFSAGVVPCPGVMTIVLFCIMLGHYSLGFLSAIAMSIGMGLTISFAGIFAIALSKRGYTFLDTKGYILEIIGGTLVILLGTFLLLSSIKY